MSPWVAFFIGLAVGGVLIAIVLNNIHSSQVKALEEKIAAQAQAAIGKAVGKN